MKPLSKQEMALLDHTSWDDYPREAWERRHLLRSRNYMNSRRFAKKAVAKLRRRELNKYYLASMLPD